MPEPLLHYALTFTLAKTRLNLRKSLLIGLAGLIPDLDVLIKIHRWATHSIILTTLIMAPIIILLYIKKKRVAWIPLVIYLAILGHITMDLFQAYTPILYPITNQVYRIDLEMNISISNSIRPDLIISIDTTPNKFTQFNNLDAPLFTSEGFITSTILIMMSIILTTDKKEFNNILAKFKKY